jgi:hypothetical protein
MSVTEDELAPNHLVLLPGLDGTGQLFGDFLKALPHTLTTTVVSYPMNRFLTYSEIPAPRKRSHLRSRRSRATSARR